MKRLFINAMILSFLYCFSACEGGQQNNQETAEEGMEENGTTSEMEGGAGQVQIAPLSPGPEYSDAMLNMEAPTDEENITAGQYTFRFDAKNFELAVPTEGQNEKNLSVSDKGQHIHLILNNNPYYAIYEPEWQHNLEEGSYVALAFLSRSWHESVKNPEAFVVRTFTVGNAAPQEVDLNAPHMFYSRPKGTYADKVDSVLLDFYLVNTDLSPDGNRVRATINGQEFVIDKWQPYVITGMPLGENTIQLELIDQDGNVIEGPFNSVTRNITLESPAS